MNITRRSFISTALAAGGTSMLPTAVCAADGDWKAVFRSVGFDPDAPGSRWFAVTSDIHAMRFHSKLAAHVAEWNSMDPAPAFVAALGDFGYLCRYFGERVTPEKAADNARIQFGAINEILSKGLKKEIGRVYVVGNHDTYNDEAGRALWRRYFPDQPPYCAFDFCGLRFLKWDGGVDGAIDAEQEKWILDECRKCPKDRQMVVLVHQQSVGMVERERDIGRIAKAAFAGRPGVTWMLGGHRHGNSFVRWDLSGGGALAVATHTMDDKGWWAYGVRDGRIAARIFMDARDGSFSAGKMPDAIPSRGAIPLAWDGRDDVVWKVFVGTSEEKACRVSFNKPYTDNGSWLCYVGTTIYRFPKGRIAPKATRYAILGDLVGRHKTREQSKLFMSADGETWTEVKRSTVAMKVNEYPIPRELAGVETLWVKYEGFGMSGGDSHGGFAFLR